MAYRIELFHEATCFVRLPQLARVTLPSAEFRPTFSCTLSDGRVVFVTCSAWTAAENQLLVSSQLATCLRLKPGELCVLSPTGPLKKCRTVRARAANAADFELLHMAADRVAATWLQKAACVWKGCQLPVWLDDVHSVVVSVESIDPADRCVLLVNSSRVEMLPPADVTSDVRRESSTSSSYSWFRRLHGTPTGESVVSGAATSAECLRLRVMPFPAGLWRTESTAAFSLLSQKLAVCSPQDLVVRASGGVCWYWAEVDSGKSRWKRCAVLLTCAGRACSLPQLSDVWSYINCLYDASSDSSVPSCAPTNLHAVPLSGQDLVGRLCQPGSILLPDIVRRQLGVCVSDSVRLSPIVCSAQLKSSVESCISAENNTNLLPSYSGTLNCIHPLYRLSSIQLQSLRHTLAGWCRLLCLPSMVNDRHIPSLIGGSKRLLPACAGVVLDGGLVQATDEESLTEFDVLIESQSMETVDEQVHNNCDPEDAVSEVSVLRDISSVKFVAKRMSRAHSKDDNTPVHRWAPSLRELEMPVSFTREFAMCLVGADICNQLFTWLQRSFLSLLVGGASSSGNLLLTGATGVGKTSFVRHICWRLAASPLYAYSELVLCRSLLGKRADSVINRISAALDRTISRQPSVLVLDDLDHLLSGAGVDDSNWRSKQYSQQICLSLVDKLTALRRHCSPRGHRVVVIVTSSEDVAISRIFDESVLSLFGHQVSVPSPDCHQRTSILSLLSSLPASSCESAAADTDGYVLRDLCRLVTHAATLTGSINSAPCSTDVDNQRLTGTHLMMAISCVVPASRIDVVGAQTARTVHKPLPTVEASWPGVGGLQKQKNMLHQLVARPLLYRRLYARVSRWQRSRLLIYGPPGCGKTLLVRALSNHLAGHVNFFNVKGPELLSKFVGASEAAVRNLFQRASRAAPAVIFFDEFDALAARRGHDSTGVTDRCVNQLLTELDGVESGGTDGDSGSVAIIAATCRPDLVDPALLRPGRLGRTLMCPPPDNVTERHEILQTLLAGGGSGVIVHDDVCALRLAEKSMSHRLSSADLCALFTDARIHAVHDWLETTGKVNGDSQSQYCDVSVVCGPDLSEDQRNSLVERFGNLSSSHTTQSASTHPVIIRQHHLLTALDSLRPSVSEEQWRCYDRLYSRFGGERVVVEPVVSQRITLA